MHSQLEEVLMAAAAAVLGERLGGDRQLTAVTLHAKTPGGYPVQLTMEAHAPRPAETHAAGATAATKQRLRDKAVAALQAADKPLKGPTLAKRCHHAYDGRFRAVLASLADEGLVHRPDGGYWLVARPLPRPESAQG